MRHNEDKMGGLEVGAMGGGASLGNPWIKPLASPPPTTPTPAHASAEFCHELVLSLSGLKAFARRLTTNRSDAAELVQSTCLRALENWCRFQMGAPGDFRRWVMTIMANLHRDGLRKRRREILRGEVDSLPDDRVPEPAPPWQDLKVASVDAAVSALPQVLQGTYLLFSIDRLSYAEIATRVKVPPRTVGTRIFRARALLRSALAKELPVEARF